MGKRKGTLEDMEKLIKQFIGFGIVGVTNVLVTYGVYYVLLFIGINYLIANTIGYVAGILNSYYWNNRFVFKKGNSKAAITIAKVFACYGVTYLLNMSLLYVLVNYIHVSKTISPVIVIIVTIPFNFMLNKFWAFKENRKRK